MKAIPIASLVFLHTACTVFAVSESLLKKPDAWFRDPDGREAIKNVLAWQTESGSWAASLPSGAPNTTRPP